MQKVLVQMIELYEQQTMARTTSKDINRTLYIIQWSTWEREEWLIDDEYYQINASGTDDVPDSHIQKYKEYVAKVNWKKKTKEAHEDIWQFHLELEELGAKHIFFNGNNDFCKVKDKNNGVLVIYNLIV